MKTQSIGHLVDEHREISRVLDAFEHFLREVRTRGESAGAGDLPPPKEIAAIFDYMHEHLLMRHEEKEELCILPALSRHGISWSDANLQHTRQEHRHVRYLMRVLRQSVHQTRAWTAEDRRHFEGTGEELLGFLRRHMDAEERHLFGKLDELLTEEEDEMTLSDMKEIDGDFAAMPDAKRLHERGAAFVERYA